MASNDITPCHSRSHSALLPSQLRPRVEPPRTASRIISISKGPSSLRPLAYLYCRMAETIQSKSAIRKEAKARKQYQANPASCSPQTTPNTQQNPAYPHSHSSQATPSRNASYAHYMLAQRSTGSDSGYSSLSTNSTRDFPPQSSSGTKE